MAAPHRIASSPEVPLKPWDVSPLMHAPVTLRTLALYRTLPSKDIKAGRDRDAPVESPH